MINLRSRKGCERISYHYLYYLSKLCIVTDRTTLTNDTKVLEYVEKIIEAWCMLVIKKYTNMLKNSKLQVGKKRG